MASKYQQIHYLKQQFLIGETIKWDHSFQLLLSFQNMNDFITDNMLLHSPWSVQVDLIIFHTTKYVVLLIICNKSDLNGQPIRWFELHYLERDLELRELDRDLRRLSRSLSRFPSRSLSRLRSRSRSLRSLSRDLDLLFLGDGDLLRNRAPPPPLLRPHRLPVKHSCQLFFNRISTLDNYHSTWKSFKQIVCEK